MMVVGTGSGRTLTQFFSSSLVHLPLCLENDEMENARLEEEEEPENKYDKSAVLT